MAIKTDLDSEKKRQIIKITPSPYLPFHTQPHSVTECSTFSSLQCRAMGNGGLWSVHKGSSLLFLPSHNFPLLQSGSFRINLLPCGLFTGCISFRSQPHALPCHDPLCGCRGISALAPGPPPPTLLPLISVLAGLCHTPYSSLLGRTLCSFLHTCPPNALEPSSLRPVCNLPIYS